MKLLPCFFLVFLMFHSASSGEPSALGTSLHSSCDGGKGAHPESVIPKDKIPKAGAVVPVTKPPVVSRSNWGCPDGANSPDWAPLYTAVGHLIVHHSDTANTSGDWKAEVRSIWQFHKFTRGWGDIGYNYLIDPNGIIYEGRAGGDNVIGAHFSCQNGGTFGVCLLGTFTTLSPSVAALSSLKQLLAWKAAQRGIDPLGSSFHSGTQLTLPNICGHRNGNPAYPQLTCSTTECPGNILYGLLPSIRNDTKSLIDGGGSGQTDLTIVEPVVVSPSSVAVGAIVRVDWTERNKGGVASSPAHNTKVFLSSTPYGTTHLLATYASNPLGAGESRSYFDANLPIPASIPAGEYYVTVFVDSGLAVGESDNNNNIGSSSPNKLIVGGQQRVSPSLEFNGQESPPGDQNPTLAKGTDFDNVPVSQSASHVFRLYNYGTINLTLNGNIAQLVGTHAGDFTITSLPSSPIAPNQYSTLEVRFRPTATGLRTANLQIHFDATYAPGISSPYTVALQGIGTSSPDNTAPTVSITDPTSGTTFVDSRTVVIHATASDNVGVTKVEFYDGSSLVSSSATAPYAHGWQITSAENGVHNWTARAYDAAGNVTTSTSVSVTVNIEGCSPEVLLGPITNPANGHSYYLLQKATWTCSEQKAQSLNGHLVTINDAAEHQWVLSTFGSPYFYLWIGLNDDVSEGNFVWSSGESATYRNWFPGEPNNTSATGGRENYVVIYNFDGGNRQWNDMINVDQVNEFSVYGVVEVSSSQPETRVIALSGNLSYGVVPVGTTVTKVLTIANTGTAPLTVNGITLPIHFEAHFEAGTIAPGGTIGPGSSATLPISFNPTAAVSYSGEANINSNATAGSNTIPISGTGQNPVEKIITLSGNLSFGSLTVGSTATRTLTIANTGNATLTVSGITFPTGFSGSWPSGTIPAGSSQNVTVTFAPTAPTSYSGNVSVTSDATSGAGTLAISGAGQVAPTRVINLSGDLSFGSLTVGSTATRTLTIANTGNATLTVSGITFPSGFSGSWPSGTIPAGGSQNVTVTFAPLSVNTYSGNIVILSDATSGIPEIPATGASSQLEVKFDSLNRQPNGNYRFVIVGQIGKMIIIETSADLLTWGELARFPNVAGRTEYIDSSVLVSHLFYRFRQE